MVAPYSGAMLAIVARFGQGEGGSTFAKEFDELAHDFLFAQQFGNSQHQIGCSYTFF